MKIQLLLLAGFAGVACHSTSSEATGDSASALTEWTKCANEWEHCSFTGSHQVRYGAGDKWVTKTFTDGVDCNNTAIGQDPDFGVSKTCEVASETHDNSGCAPLTPTTPDTGAGADDHHPAAYTKLVFSDEFDGASLDRGKWCTRYVYGGGPALQVPDPACLGPKGTDGTLDFLNDERERYRDFNAKNEPLHVLSDGTLKLQTTKTGADAYASYESGMIRSKWELKPTAATSYFVLSRVKLPDVVGTWPAFWLNSGFGTTGELGWPPEIDIIDAAYNGKDDRNDMLHMASINHGKQTASGQTETTYAAASYDKTWSNYVGTSNLRGVWLELGLEWTADSACWYLDGTKVLCQNYRWVLDSGATANTASILLNLAVGGGWAGRYGIDDAHIPAALEIDYVRVYSN